MNPPISGQYMARKHIRGRGERGAAGGRHACSATCSLGDGERPGHLQAALLAEDEAQLAGRAQPIGMGRAEGRTGPVLGDRAQQILMKEAVLAARFRGRRPTIRHTSPRPRSDLKLTPTQDGHQSGFSPPSRNGDSRKSQELLACRGNTCKLRGLCVIEAGTARIFRSFEVAMSAPSDNAGADGWSSRPRIARRLRARGARTAIEPGGARLHRRRRRRRDHAARQRRPPGGGWRSGPGCSSASEQLRPERRAARGAGGRTRCSSRRRPSSASPTPTASSPSPARRRPPTPIMCLSTLATPAPASGRRGGPRGDPLVSALRVHRPRRQPRAGRRAARARLRGAGGDRRPAGPRHPRARAADLSRARPRAPTSRAMAAGADARA